MTGAFSSWLRRHALFFTRATILVIAALATLVSIAGVSHFAPLMRVDEYIRDYEIAWLTPPEPKDPNIVVAAITENTFRATGLYYREPVDRGFLAQTLTNIAAAHPRAIALDVLADEPSDPAKDKELRDVLHSLKIPLVVAYSENWNLSKETDINAGHEVDPFRFLKWMVPESARGDVALGTDDKDTARFVVAGSRESGRRYVLGFSRAIAAKLGVQTPDHDEPIVWHGRPAADDTAFTEIPVEFSAALKPLFANKVVLVGSDITLRDQHRTPFSVSEEFGRGLMPGVMIQAHSLAQFLEHRQPPDVGFAWNLVITIIAAFAGAWLGSENFSLPARVGASVLAVGLFLTGGAALYRYADTQIALVAPSLALALALWAVDSLTGFDARRQREFLHGAFSRYVSPKLVERLVREPERMSLQGERRLMTYLFSDIESFTTLSEGLESHQLATMLNAYLEGVTSCVLDADGMVDKFIGDAVFAIFNAPLDLANHEQRAVQCAIAMNRFASDFAKEQQAHGIAFGRTRIGIHSGTAVIGNFGSSTRFNYTASGDAVNLASRLEGLNKYFGTQIIVSEATRRECPAIAFRPVAEVVVMGKTEPIAVWEPLLPQDRAGDHFITRYIAAYDALKRGDPTAPKLFDDLRAEAPDDPLVRLHSERIAAGEQGVVITMSDK